MYCILSACFSVLNALVCLSKYDLGAKSYSLPTYLPLLGVLTVIRDDVLVLRGTDHSVTVMCREHAKIKHPLHWSYVLD